MDTISFLDWSLVIFTLLQIVVQVFWNTIGGETYMDEIFHVPQTQRYCHGDFAYWDPKITTLPGLYVLGQP